MVKPFYKKWKLWIFTFLILFSVIYIFRQNTIPSLANILKWHSLLSASLNYPSNQLDQRPALDLLSDLPNGQSLKINKTENLLSNEDINIEGEQLFLIESKQDKIDDILEKIDILQRQIADLIVIKNENNKKVEDEAIKEFKEEVIEIDQEPQKQNNIEFVSYVSGGSNKVYPKILISEAQIGCLTDSKQEFVELYNPNDQEVDLSSWYLQRKTKTVSDYVTFAPNTLFSGKRINSNGYFLIARQDYFINLADIFIDNPLTKENSLIIKNPNGEISDKLGWGEAQDYELVPAQNPIEGQSIGRKPEQGDTDNNSIDFEIDTPTPKAQNTAYVAPIIPPEEPAFPTKNIVINEIKTEGQTVKDEFIELYNPNEFEVDLKSFALKKKTSTGTESNLVGDDSFLGIIPASGYFLIAPQSNDDESQNYTGLAAPDLYYSGKTFSVADNNTVLLYNDSGTLLDKAGFGQAQDFENAPSQNPETGKSLSRKLNGQDTDDNLADFEINTPTPKAQNIVYVASIDPIEAVEIVEPVEPVEPEDSITPIKDPPEIVLENILINEIQITGVTAKDEFIELYNPNDTNISLDGFSLKKKVYPSGNETNLIKSSDFIGTIPALGYFLIAPQVDSDGTLNYTGLATPDLYYSVKSASIAFDNAVLLYDKDDILQDKVGFGTAQDFETAPAENPPKDKSIERKILGQDADDNSQDFKISDESSPKENFSEVIIEAPIIEAPIIEAPIIEAPIIEAPIIEEPIIEEPIIEEPIIEEPIIEEPIIEEPIIEEPIEPFIELPVEHFIEPIIDDPIDDPSVESPPESLTENNVELVVELPVSP